MRAMLWVGATVVMVLSLALAGTVMTNVIGSNQAALASMNCNAALGPVPQGGSGNGQLDASRLNDEQRQVAALIISVGKERSMPPLAWQVAIQAGMTESGLRNLGYGDRDSLGIFQMRPTMGWGSSTEVTDPVYAVHKFYDVLRGIPDWQQQRPGESAQDVERSAFPDRYHKWESMAAHLIGNIGEVADPVGCGPGMGSLLPAPTEAAGGAMMFAMGQQGKPYEWGAATTHTDSFDCSSLMLQAYRSAGVMLPRVSREQYRAGALLPVTEAQPGDLLFWAYDRNDPDTIHHVAMYLGDGKIVEAQQTGVPVHVRPVAWDEGELVAQAVRPGV